MDGSWRCTGQVSVSNKMLKLLQGLSSALLGPSFMKAIFSGGPVKRPNGLNVPQEIRHLFATTDLSAKRASRQLRYVRNMVWSSVR
jgi:hypothetical protein